MIGLGIDADIAPEENDEKELINDEVEEKVSDDKVEVSDMEEVD